MADCSLAELHWTKQMAIVIARVDWQVVVEGGNDNWLDVIVQGMSD